MRLKQPQSPTVEAVTHEGWWEHANGTWGYYRFEGTGWVFKAGAASEQAIEEADRYRRWGRADAAGC